MNAFIPSLAKQMKQLNSRIQVNHLGLPEGIYRPDMLPTLPSPPDLELITSQCYNEAHQVPQVSYSHSQSGIAETETETRIENVQGDLFHEDQSSVSTNSDGSKDSKAIVNTSSYATVVANRIAAAEESYQMQLARYDRDLSAAYVHLDYSEGYPTLGGMPFWCQFSFEPSDAYALFECYLSQYKTGARQLVAVLDAPLINELPIKPSLQELEALFHIYSWSLRAKASDLFYTAHRRKERERRAIETEDEHYMMAARLMSICDLYLTRNGDELIETMTPKAFIEFMKTATQLQRISVGLNANGPDKSQENNSAGTSAEVIMRTIAQKNNVGNLAITQENNGNNTEHDDKLSEIMKNPDLLKMAQEIIVRVSN